MNTYSIIRWSLASLLTALLSAQSFASGAIGDHVNDLQSHLKQYTEEVNWLQTKIGSVVDAYESKGKKAANSDLLIEFWEEVDFHSAIETTFVPVYASIWQGLYGVKTAIDSDAPIADVRREQTKLDRTLWQALGVVKLAAKYQQKGLVEEIQTTENEPVTPLETLDDIQHRLDVVVAKYAEQLTDVAKTMVHDTYLHRFEGVEGALISEDADLVEDLEKDFNVTLPQAIEVKGNVEAVQTVVTAMQAKLDTAKSLLEKAEKERKDVF